MKQQPFLCTEGEDAKNSGTILIISVGVGIIAIITLKSIPPAIPNWKFRCM
jgi:hypothetical protein